MDGVSGSQEFSEIAGQFRQFQSQMKDPVLVGAMMHQLTEERRSTNALLKQINEKLEKISEIESRLRQMEAKMLAAENKVPVVSVAAARQVEVPFQMLSSTDEKILEFVRSNGKACAQDLKKQFNYKGTNAASSRLNALWKQGLLDKKYAGKVVYFVAKVSQVS